MTVMVLSLQSVKHSPLSPKEKTQFVRFLALRRGFPSLRALAEACGVTYEHLRYVILGERESRVLKQKLIRFLGPEVREVWE